MLVQFTTENYLSFNKKTSLKLVASPDSDRRDANVFDTSVNDISLLKSLVIYGPNASGKSNMFKALNFMRWFVLNSAKDLQAAEGIDVSCYKLSTQTIHQPSFFEIEIIISETKYRYGFRVDERIVHEEWLFYQRKVKEYPLFERVKQDIQIDSKFEFIQDDLKKSTRENALFLSLAAQFNNATATQIIKKFGDFHFVSGVSDENKIDLTARLLQNKRFEKLIKSIMLGAGLGFNDIVAERHVNSADMFKDSGIPKTLVDRFLKDRPESFVVRTAHDVFDENDKPVRSAYLSLLENESLGTQKFFSLTGPIVQAIVTGGTLLVDEFSSRMSPVLCEAIIRLFNSVENNPYGAQFLFVTHNLQFITKNSNVFRRDQMILFKKDRYGASDVSSLYDRRIRKDASFDKEYLTEIHDLLPKLDISGQLNLFDGRAI